MKLCAFVVVALLGQIAVAQGRQDAQAQRDSQQEVSTWPGSPYFDSESQEQPSADEDNVCFTMRTYLFARKDAEQPRMVATYTCTRSHQRDLRRAKAAEPRLVPAK